MKFHLGFFNTGTARTWLGLLLVLALCSGSASALEATPSAQDPVVEARMIHISEELRCLVCQNESLASSRAELANDLREEVRGLIRQDKSDTDIKEFLVSRYGDFVLYRPPVKPVTWLLWIGPFVILGIGIAGLLMYLRRRNSSVPNIVLTDADNQKIDALLNAADKKEG